MFRSSLPESERLSVHRLVDDVRTRGRAARTLGSVDDIVAALAHEVRDKDLVVVMSNGGFGGIHRKLLTALGGSGAQSPESRAQSLPSSMSDPRLRDAGDSMLLLEFEPVVDVTVNARAIGTAADVRARAIPGLRDVRATLRSVAVEYDPLLIDRDGVADALMRAAHDAVPRQGREIEVPVVYGGDVGPDLTDVAARSTGRVHGRGAWWLRSSSTSVG